MAWWASSEWTSKRRDIVELCPISVPKQPNCEVVWVVG